MEQESSGSVTEETRATKKREGIRGWLTACALSRWFVAGELSIVGIAALRWPPISSVLARKILARAVTQAQVAATGHKVVSQEVSIVIIAVFAVIGVISALPFLRKRTHPLDTILSTHSEQSLHVTTILSGLAFLTVTFGYEKVQNILQRSPASGTDFLLDLATYLQSMQWVAAAGMILVVASILTQPFVNHLKTRTKVLLVAGEACIVTLCLIFRSTAVLVEVALLHLTVANIMLSITLGKSGDEPNPIDDQGWIAVHQKSL